MHPALIHTDKVFNHLTKLKKGEIPEASKFGIPQIDDHLRFKRGNFIVVTGHANVGKTHTMLFLMLLHTLNNGTRWIVYSSENDVRSVQRKLIEFLGGKPIQVMRDSEFQDHFNYIQERFVFINPESLYNVFDLLQTMGEIYDEWPFDGAFIDPYNSLVVDRKKLGNVSEHQYHYEATSEIRVFCKQYDCTVILNTHPATQALRKLHTGNHEYSGHPMPPYASDVEGGGKFVNRADEFVVIHRYTQHQTDWRFSDIHIRKVKELETGGRPTPLENPIRIESMKNNVGYLLNGGTLINLDGVQEDIF